MSAHFNRPMRTLAALAPQSKATALAALCLSLAACQTQQQTAAAQCGLGAAGAAYLTCKLLGKSDSQCLAAAVVGGGVGAVVCHNYADRLDKRRQALAGQENNLDARIRYVRGLNEDSAQFVTALGEQVATSSKRTDDLLVRYRQGKLTQTQLAEEGKKLDQDVAVASTQLKKGDEALQEVKTFRAQRKPNSADLDVAIVQQERLLADARRQVDQLAAQRARV